jgi:hypothetical protein
MSVPGPPSQPRASAPSGSIPVRRGEAAYLTPEGALWWDEIRSRLRSLTTALTLVLAVACIALGVGLWALLADADDEGGASAARVRTLEQRVQQLEAVTRRGASRDGLAAVQEQQRVLAGRLAALRESVRQPTDDVAALQTAVDATQQAVDQLDQRIAALEERSPVP